MRSGTASPGEHFWHIAEEAVSDPGGDASDDEEVASYWHRLVEATVTDCCHPVTPT